MQKLPESKMGLRLGALLVLLGIIATAVSPFTPQSQLFVAFLSIGMFSLGAGVMTLVFAVRLSKLEKQSSQPPPPPPPPQP